MTVMTGSLDYLYYNGILDHIPYEAYEQLPVNNGMLMSQQVGNTGLSYGSPYSSSETQQGQYLDFAMSGNAYNTYNNSKDMYSPINVKDIKNNQNKTVPPEDSEYKKQIEPFLEKTDSNKSDKFNLSPIVKGIIGATIMTGTLFLLFKGKKKP